MAAQRTDGQFESQPVATASRPRAGRYHQVAAGNRFALARIYACHLCAMTLYTIDLPVAVENRAKPGSRLRECLHKQRSSDLRLLGRVDGAADVGCQQRFALARFNSAEPVHLQTQWLPFLHALTQDGDTLRIRTVRRAPVRSYSTRIPFASSSSVTRSGKSAKLPSNRSASDPGPESGPRGASSPAAALEACAPISPRSSTVTPIPLLRKK